MTSPSGNSKICTACGADCSGKPRTKDAKGRYFCKECYDHALQAKAAASSKSAEQSFRPPSAEVEEEPFNLLGELLPANAAPPQQSNQCPNCGGMIAQGAVLCTGCGFNIQTGRGAHTTRISKAKPPRVSQGGAIWPIVVGVGSIVFGASGVLLYGAQALLTLASGGFSIGNLGGAGLAVSLSAWLLRNGVWTMKREPGVVNSMRLWAIVKLLVYGGCMILLLALPQRSFAEAYSRAGKGELDPSMIQTMLVALLVWFAFWPVTMLVVFATPRILNDVKMWR